MSTMPPINHPYKEGMKAKIKEDIRAHPDWKGAKIVIEEIPSTFNDFSFRVIGDDEIYSFLNFDEIEPLGPTCGHDVMYHDKREEYFCPWCEEDEV